MAVDRIGKELTVDEGGFLQEQDSGLIIREVEKPRHAEELSLRESAAFQPWEVRLEVQLTEAADGTVPTYYYVRAPNPSAAAVLANKHWVMWERKGKPTDMYPDTISATVLVLDEKEWEEAWDKVRRNPRHKRVGLITNPSVFVNL